MSGRWLMRSGVRRATKRPRAGTRSNSSSISFGLIQRNDIRVAPHALTPAAESRAARDGGKHAYDDRCHRGRLMQRHFSNGGARRILAAEQGRLARQGLTEETKLLTHFGGKL